MAKIDIETQCKTVLTEQWSIGDRLWEVEQVLDSQNKLKQAVLLGSSG